MKDLKNVNETNETSSQVSNKMTTQIEFAENSDQLSAEEVSDNESEGIDCDINLSNNETIDGSIDESSQQNCKTSEDFIKKVENTNENIDSNDCIQNTSKSVTKENEIQSEDNSQQISNENEILIKDVKIFRKVRKSKVNSKSGESEDIEIECNDNSDTDIDYNSNAEQISDDSDEESEEMYETENQLNDKTFTGSPHIIQYY